MEDLSESEVFQRKNSTGKNISQSYRAKFVKKHKVAQFLCTFIQLVKVQLDIKAQVAILTWKETWPGEAAGSRASEAGSLVKEVCTGLDLSTCMHMGLSQMQQSKVARPTGLDNNSRTK